MIRSVRFSLTLWYVGILAVILCVFGSLLYSNVRANLFRSIDTLLVAEADGVADAIYSFWKAESEALPPSVQRQLPFHEEIAVGHFPEMIKRWIEETDEIDTSPPVRILSAKLQVLAFSPVLAKWDVPVRSDILRKGVKGVYETYTLSDSGRVRVWTHPVLQGGKILYYIQIITSLRQADVSLDRMRTWLAALIPLTLFLTSLIGWFLASLVLRPIGKMTRQAREMSESRLHQRIDVPRTGDELQRLAVTFNEMLDRFEKGFKRLRQFSAAASHELRTPLTVMKGEMELALLKPRSEESYQEVLRNQLSVVNDMARVVEQLLSVAHAEDGELAVNWEPIMFDDLVRSVCQSHSGVFLKKNIAVTVVAPRAFKVKGEKSLLERLVANLLENAIKHTPVGGNVRLSLDGKEGNVALVVTDSGKGIPAEEMPRIFEKFFNRSIPSDGSLPSTGIGLGLCRWIVELHKGTIEASNAPGGGAQFKILLPAFPAAHV